MTRRERKVRRNEERAARLLAVPAHDDAGSTDALDGLRARIEGQRRRTSKPG